MKKILAYLLLLLPVFSWSQTADRMVGSWAGELKVNGIPVSLRFTIKAKYDGYQTRVDVPAQFLKNFLVTRTTINNRNLKMELEEIEATYTGKRIDSNTIKGTYTQSGKSQPLVLKKVWGLWPIPKPQTPKAPFPYLTTEVRINAGGGHVRIAGSYSRPDSMHKFPAIIFISGSGSQDRDESIGNHHPFAVLAATFVKMGFAVLRCDDRGAGLTRASEHALRQTTSASLAADIKEFIKFLREQPDVDTSRIGLIGHSEGGMIAPMVAAENPGIAFIVSMAGVFTGGIETSVFQNHYGLKQAKVKERHISSYLKLHRAMLNAIVQANDTTDFKPAFDSILNHWKHHGATLAARKFVMGSHSARKKTWNNYAAFFNPWWKFFLSYDVKPDLASLHCPILAINGSKDVQVPCDPNLEIVKNNVSNRVPLQTKCIPGLNHLFQECKECTIQEYFTLEQTISPEVVGLIAAWLKQEVLTR